jgi:hypothetical protein
MRATLVAAAWAFFVGFGCVLVTDLDTSGYRPVAGDAQSAACSVDAGCDAFALGCVAAADCPGSGQICCLELSSTASASTGCASGPACASAIQLCHTDAECPGVHCVSQQCTVGGLTATLQVCGTVCSR